MLYPSLLLFARLNPRVLLKLKPNIKALEEDARELDLPIGLRLYVEYILGGSDRGVTF
jgi:hypothetical protein